MSVSSSYYYYTHNNIKRKDKRNSSRPLIRQKQKQKTSICLIILTMLSSKDIWPPYGNNSYWVKVLSICGVQRDVLCAQLRT